MLIRHLQLVAIQTAPVVPRNVSYGPCLQHIRAPTDQGTHQRHDARQVPPILPHVLFKTSVYSFRRAPPLPVLLYCHASSLARQPLGRSRRCRCPVPRRRRTHSHDDSYSRLPPSPPTSRPIRITPGPRPSSPAAYKVARASRPIPTWKQGPRSRHSMRASALRASLPRLHHKRPLIQTLQTAMQPNGFDCGLYVWHHVDAFFQHSSRVLSHFNVRILYCSFCRHMLTT